LIFSWFALANLWLTFAIIIDLLPSEKLFTFGNAEVVSSGSPYTSHEAALNWPTQTHWVNFAFKSIYLCFLALQVSQWFSSMDGELFDSSTIASSSLWLLAIGRKENEGLMLRHSGMLL
jgi:hypothetical protein